MINFADFPKWQPPWRTSGKLNLLRVSSTALKTNLVNCQMEKVAKAHIGLNLEAKDWSVRKDPRAAFLLGPVRAILAMVKTPVDLDEVILHELGDQVTPPSIAAAKHMVRNALVATEEFAAEDLAVDLVLTPTADYVCVATSEAERLELTSWGIYYQSQDKSLRELRLLCYRDAELTRDRNQLIAAVNILLNGALSDGSPIRWTDPYQTLPTNPPARVRVRQIGCMDASAATLFDGDAASAAAFVGGISNIVQEFFTEPQFLPGNNCVECRCRISCPAITKMPGFFGLPTAGKISKSLSRGMLNTYQRCNYQYFLSSVLKLPKQVFEPSAAILRGTAVHDWINQAHLRQIACSLADLPEFELGEIAIQLGWHQDYLNQVRGWLVSHIEVCPLKVPETKLRSEQSHTIWDSDADIVLTTRADESGTRGDKPLWREIKTSSSLPELSVEDYLILYPQVAFAIKIQADPGGMVELELLTPEKGMVISFDSADPKIELAAQRAIAINFDQLHHDEQFQPSPGIACGSCAVSAWCDKRIAQPVSRELLADGLEVDLVTGEIVNSEPVAIDALAKALALIEPAEDAEDLPF